MSRIYNTCTQMRHATIYTTEKEYSHFINLVNNLHYVKKIEPDYETEESILNNVKSGLEEVRLFNNGKLKTTPAKDFLYEL